MPEQSSSAQHSGPPIWFYPLVYTLSCLLLSLWTGALDVPSPGDVRAQRDFNAALGMPVITGYLWLTIRLLHRRSAVQIVNFLLSIGRLHDFDGHREALIERLYRHTVIAVSLAVGVTILYLSTEGLLALDQQPHVLLLNMLAVPFWFFLWLFLLQVCGTTRYIIREFIQTNESQHQFESMKSLVDLSITNVIYATFAIALVPIFWIGKSVPLIDVVILGVFASTILFYLIRPVVKAYALIKRYKQSAVATIDEKMNRLYEQADQMTRSERLNQLHVLQNKKEHLQLLSPIPLDLPQCLKVIIVFALIPLSWLMLTQLTVFTG